MEMDNCGAVAMEKGAIKTGNNWIFKITAWQSYMSVTN